MYWYLLKIKYGVSLGLGLYSIGLHEGHCVAVPLLNFTLVSCKTSHLFSSFKIGLALLGPCFSPEFWNSGLVLQKEIVGILVDSALSRGSALKYHHVIKD